MGKFTNQTTKINIMKKQNQFVQAMKCCLTNGKFVILLFSSILLFTSCKQSGSQNSESISDQVSNLISSNPCDKFIGKYSRQQTASSITTTSTIEIKKDQDFYKLYITALSTTNNPAFEMAVQMTNDRSKAIFPADGFVCTCNQKGNIELSLEGKTVESMIDNNGNLIYGGLTFYKTTNENNKETTEATENATTTDIEVVQGKDLVVTGEDVESIESNPSTKTKLPFTGLRYFNFDNDYHTRYSISIEENGNCVVKRVGYYGESIETTYNGKYEKVINTDNAQNYSIQSNKIYFVDYSGNNLTDGNTGKAIYSELTTEKIGHK